MGRQFTPRAPDQLWVNDITYVSSWSGWSYTAFVTDAYARRILGSFFSLLQKNVLNRRRWNSRQQLRLAIAHWIEATYHRRRRQRALGKLTPIEYETIYQTATAA